MSSVADLTLPLTRRLTRPLTFPLDARGDLGTGGVSPFAFTFNGQAFTFGGQPFTYGAA